MSAIKFSAIIHSLILVPLFLAIVTSPALSQKLPNTQTLSVLAPNGIKIDGKAIEWSQFQAYNNAIECFYTISNDKTNLYLTVKATDHGIIQKIAAGGITLTIINTGKNNKVTPFNITYPLVPPAFSPGISYTLRSNKTLSETQLSGLNAQISSHVKDIPLTGAKGIADSSISIYNDYGIKAAGLINEQKAYICEMAIPVRYIEQLFDAAGTFKYRIQVNGLDNSGKDGFIVVGGSGLNTPPSEAAVNHASAMFLTAPTYVQGTYTLAK